MCQQIALKFAELLVLLIYNFLQMNMYLPAYRYPQQQDQCHPGEEANMTSTATTIASCQRQHHPGVRVHIVQLLLDMGWHKHFRMITPTLTSTWVALSMGGFILPMTSYNVVNMAFRDPEPELPGTCDLLLHPLQFYTFQCKGTWRNL